MQLYSKAVAFLIVFLFVLVPLTINAGQSFSYGAGSPDYIPPVTYLSFDSETGIVNLTAIDRPFNSPWACGIWYTAYIIDEAGMEHYNEPFILPEGTHVLTYWSVDLMNNHETPNKETLTFDIVPPTVIIATPELGGIYLFGNRILTLGDKTICIGRIQITVTANDGNGSGVETVFFNFSNGDTGYDDNATDGWSYNFNNAHFGEIEITVTAMDKKELMSEPETMTIEVYSLGIL